MSLDMSVGLDVVSPLVTALTWIAAGLLVVAGASKLPVPDAAMATLHALGLPSGRSAARVLGLAEVALGSGVVVAGGQLAAGALAGTYLVLLAVAWRQRARRLDCGCFGMAAAPVTALHLGINATAAAAGVIGLVAAPDALAEVARDAGGLGATAALVLLATATALVRTAAVQAVFRLRATGPAGAGA